MKLPPNYFRIVKDGKEKVYAFDKIQAQHNFNGKIHIVFLWENMVWDVLADEVLEICEMKGA